MPISENARAVLERRYLIRDEHGEAVETVDELFHRVADAVAAADVRFDPLADVADTAQSFYRMMTELDFLPNWRCRCWVCAWRRLWPPAFWRPPGSTGCCRRPAATWWPFRRPT